MSKHTPGPWKEEIDDVMQAASVRDASNRGVCPVAGMTFDERKANAALIAAAPMQHDALKLAEQYLAKRVGHLPTSEGYKVLAAIREAIARASGES